MSRTSILKLLLLTALVVSLGGCMRGCTSARPPIHPNPNMDHQPKYLPQASSAYFYNGATMRPVVEGTVARGELREDRALFEGKDAEGGYVASSPVTIDEALLNRGEERYNIYCAPCHAARGNGQGILWQRAQIPTADLREERIRNMSDGEIYDIITHGKGLMSGYKYPIPPRDRWAIIAHVRKLQQRVGS